MTLPTLIPEQRVQALEKAAAARSHRARIRSELKSGELKLSEFFTASETDDALGEMKVRAPLISLPRVGTTTADAIPVDVHIAESRRVHRLGANQRAALVERFGQEGRLDAGSCRRVPVGRDVAMTDIAATDPSAPALAHLTILAGPTAVGKGTVVTKLRRRHPDLFISVSATTRRSRPGEVDGVHYHFVSDEDFDSLVASGQMLEWALIYGAHRYGTPRGPVQDRLDVGCSALLGVDLDGARQVRRVMSEARLVLLAPPSWEGLVHRFVGRGIEDAQEQERRLVTARTELDAAGEFDHVVINDTVASAIVELERLMGLGSQNNVTLNYRD